MITIAPAFYISALPTEVEGGFTQSDVDWYSLFSDGASVHDSYGNSEPLYGSLGANNPRIGFNNLLLPRTLQADHEDPLHPALNLGTPSTAEKWKTAAGQEQTAQTLYFSTEEFGGCDYIGIAGHNLGSLGASYKLQSRGGIANFQEVDVGGNKTGASVAISTINGIFEFLISVDGGAYQVVTLNYPSTSGLTYSALIADINGQLVGAQAAIENGNLRFTSNQSAPAGSVQLQSSSGVNYFATYLNGYVSIDNSSGWADVFAAQSPQNDNPIFYQFSPLAGRYWRLVLTPAAGATERMQIAVLYIGRALIVPRKLYVGHTPITYGRVTKKITNRSESGHYLGQVVTSGMLQTKIEFENIGPLFYRVWVDAFVRHARSRPFFWAWRPGQYPDECGYSWTTADIVPENTRNNGMVKFSAQIESVAL